MANTSEVLVNLKKYAEAALMELKRLDVCNQQAELALKSRDSLIREINELREVKKGVQKQIEADQAARLAEIHEMQKAAQQKEIDLDRKRQELQRDSAILSSAQTNLNLALEKTKRDQDEARETMRIYNLKMDQLKAIMPGK